MMIRKIRINQILSRVSSSNKKKLMSKKKKNGNRSLNR